MKQRTPVRNTSAVLLTEKQFKEMDSPVG